MKSRHSFVCSCLLGIYILLIGVQEPFYFPLFEGKIQISDFWFVIMLCYTFFQQKVFLTIFSKIFQDSNFSFFFYSAILYLILNGISVSFSYTDSGFYEWVGKLYLFIMCNLVLCYFILIHNKIRIFLFFRLLGYSLSIIGLAGWALSYLGFENFTTQIYLDYPYFGDTHRLCALTTTPSMFISMITICILLSLCNYLFYDSRTIRLLEIILFCAAAYLSFTKSFLLIAAGVSILYLFKHYKRWQLICFLYLGFVCLLIFLSHYLIVRNQDLVNPSFRESPYTSNELVYSNSTFSIVGSGYYSFKKTAWRLFQRNPYIGIGPGNYNQKVGELKAEGLHPNNLPNYDPHSTYLGALAETGLPGFCALLILILSIFKLISSINYKKDPFSFCLSFLFIIILTESISMDTMNFRHYWIVFALILYQYFQTKNSSFEIQQTNL